jgi:lipopolysaccharide/colanic/teichoic acid biosynthesis glycosyltransferase
MTDPADALGLPRYHRMVITFEWLSYAVLKRALDVAVSIGVILLTFPLWLTIMVAIKLDSPGPVFFVQERVGYRGRRFRCVKFRSMQVNAEAALEEMKRRGEVPGLVYKIRNDPRVTRMGRLLRKTSLDELPQLINVLKGEMSLVGPRPVIPAHIQEYVAGDQVRLRVKPGLTCLWALLGRSHCDIAKIAAADREYVERRSLRLDAWILYRTAIVVVRGENF